MKYRSDQQTIEFEGQTYWILAYGSGIFRSDLKKMLGQLSAMLSYHCKVHVLRFDLHQYVLTPDNLRMTLFNRRFTKWLKRTYNLKRVGFIWVRELAQVNCQHYHYALSVDGNMVNYPEQITAKAKTIWNEMDGHFSFVENSYNNISRGDHEQIQETVKRISYFAKTKDKGQTKRSAQTKDYGTSRIKPKQRPQSP